AGQAVRAAARTGDDAPAPRRDRRHRVRHQDPGRAVAVPQADPRGADRAAHRADRRADRGRRRPGRVVHRRAGPRLRIRRPRGRQHRPGGHMTHGERRYLVPEFEEQSYIGRKDTNPYNKLFEDRIVLLGAPVDDTSANDVTAQLLALEGMDADRPISLYINSPGGSLTSMLAICDTMRYIAPPVETTCVGRAGSAAAVLLAAGAPGRRAALTGARGVARPRHRPGHPRPRDPPAAGADRVDRRRGHRARPRDRPPGPGPGALLHRRRGPRLRPDRRGDHVAPVASAPDVSSLRPG